MKNQILITIIASAIIQLVSADECNDPSGADCSWYRSCLSSHYDCSQSGYEYALTYGEKYCLLFSNNAKQFSPQGQEWIENTRKCLQIELAKKLKEQQQPSELSCKQIREFAFASHASCYIKPLGKPGICDLELSQWWNVFKIIWTQFIPFYSGEFFESVQGAFQVVVGCLSP